MYYDPPLMTTAQVDALPAAPSLFAQLAGRHWRVAAIVILTAIAFAHVTTFPFSAVDDPSNVVNNPLVADPLAQGVMGLLRTTAMGYPHTVTVLSFAIDRRIFGVAPAGYHAINLLVHLVNIGLLYQLMLQL